MSKDDTYTDPDPDPAAPPTPASPRPGNRPYYVDPDCPECGTPLVLAELADGRAASDEAVLWHDEWACPAGCEGIVLDVPPTIMERLRDRAASLDADPDIAESI